MESSIGYVWLVVNPGPSAESWSSDLLQVYRTFAESPRRKRCSSCALSALKFEFVSGVNV